MVKAKPEQIRLILKTKKINITQLAEHIGVTRQAIYNALAKKPVGGKLIGGLIQLSGWDFSEIFFVENLTSKTKENIKESKDYNFTGNAPENPQVESSNVKIGKVSFEKTKGACRASDEFEKRKEVKNSKASTSRI